MKITKQQIKEVLEQNKITLPIEGKEETEQMFYTLESDLKLPFSVHLLGNTSSDYWLQAEYYSEKIRKMIILDYDLYENYETVEKVQEQVQELIDTMDILERKLPDLKV